MPDAPAEEVATSAEASRFERLTPEQHRILAYASSIGSEFDFGLLVAAMGVGEELLAEQLERLVHLGILRERAGGDRFSFAEEEFRARIYRSLTESRLRVLHRKIAEAMERMYPTPSPEVVAELGRHFFLGKVPEKSGVYNRRASENARAADDPESAAHSLERIRVDLESVPGGRPHDLAEVDEVLGVLYYSVGNFAAADRYFTEALERLGGDEPRIRARLLLARGEIAPTAPFRLTAETVVASFYGEEASLRRVLRWLQRSGFPFRVVRASRKPRVPLAPHGLTPLQVRLMARAAALGYYSIPRRITLTRLARLTGRSAPALGKILRRAEGHLVVDFLATESSAVASEGELAGAAAPEP